MCRSCLQDLFDSFSEAFRWLPLCHVVNREALSGPVDKYRPQLVSLNQRGHNLILRDKPSCLPLVSFQGQPSASSPAGIASLIGTEEASVKGGWQEREPKTGREKDRRPRRQSSPTSGLRSGDRGARRPAGAGPAAAVLGRGRRRHGLRGGGGPQSPGAHARHQSCKSSVGL